MRSATIAAIAAIAAAGCGAAGAAGGPSTTSTTTRGATTTTVAAPAGDPDTTVAVALEDYRFAGLPPSVKGPHVRFEAVNRGPSDHELEVLDEDGEPLGEIEAMPPGETGTLALELDPGTYTVQCILLVGDDTDDTHADRGMITELEVR